MEFIFVNLEPSTVIISPVYFIIYGAMTLVDVLCGFRYWWREMPRHLRIEAH